MRHRGILIIAAWSLAVAPAASAQAETTITIGDDTFQPSVAGVEPGARVVWTNTGDRDHTVTASDGSFDSFTLAPGDTYARVFDGEGRVPYFCRFHGSADGDGMAAVLRIGGSGDAEGGGTQVREERARRDPDLATTGARALPFGPLAFLAATLVALGAWLASWERIVYGRR